MGQPVVHWEFWSQEVNRLRDFYKGVFAWEIQEMAQMNYSYVHTGGQGGINGGMMTPKQGPWPSNMTFYIDVPDLGIYCEKVRQAGGQILVEKMDVPGIGSLGLFSDPDGRVIGLWQQNASCPTEPAK